jgi:excisionase family DNA binding protein
MEKLLNTNQLAELLQVKPSTIRAWVFKRKLPFLRVGARAVRFDPHAIQKFLRAVPSLRPLHHPTDPGDGEGGER